jgi:hypothetical protein
LMKTCTRSMFISAPPWGGTYIRTDRHGSKKSHYPDNCPSNHVSRKQHSEDSAGGKCERKRMVYPQILGLRASKTAIIFNYLAGHVSTVFPFPLAKSIGAPSFLRPRA